MNSSSAAESVGDASSQLELSLNRAQRQLESLQLAAPPLILLPAEAQPTPAAIAEADAAETATVAALRTFAQANRTSAGMEAVLLAGTEGWEPASEAGDKPPLSAEARLRFNELYKAAIAAREEKQRVRELDAAWTRYDNNQQQQDAYEQRMAKAEARVATLATSLTNLHAQSAAASKSGTVQGYMLPSEGLVVTPSIAIFYIARATMEAVCQLGGKLDEAAYRGQTRDKNQSLRN